MKAATLFSGIGAPEIAMPAWDWVWHAEIEKFPSAVMAARHPQSVNLGDVNAEDFIERAESIGRPDVIVFGSPCQDFSVAGQRVGLDGARGNLALVALGIVAKLRPRWLVFENVPGLLSSYSGSAEAERAVREGNVGGSGDGSEDSDFAAFLTLVQQCGYFGCYRITDAQFAGVPQRRRRIFFVGHLGDWRPAAAVLFEPEGLRWNHPPRRETWQGVTGTISARTEGGGGLGTDFDLSGGLVEATGEPNGLHLRGVPGDQRRGVVADVRVVRPGEQETDPTKSIGAFNNQGHGWWNGSNVAQTVRSGDDSGSGGARESTLLVEQGLALALNAKGGSGRLDAESETFVVAADLRNGAIDGVTQSLQGGGMGDERGRCINAIPHVVRQRKPILAFETRGSNIDLGQDVTGTIGSNVDRASGSAPCIVFDETQITSAENRCQPHSGDPCHPLAASPRPPAIAFTCKDYGGDATVGQSPTLRSMGHDGSHPNGGGQIAIAFSPQAGGNQTTLGFDPGSNLMSTQGAHQTPAVAINMRGREGGAMPEISDTASLRSPSGGSSRSFTFKPSHFTRGKDGQPSGVSPPLGAEPDKGDQDPVLFTGSAVRRLTPRECERLQSYPDDFTLIKFRGKPASDGPRYKALGNSMCVNEVRWILERIEMFENIK